MNHLPSIDSSGLPRDAEAGALEPSLPVSARSRTERIERRPLTCGSRRPLRVGARDGLAPLALPGVQIVGDRVLPQLGDLAVAGRGDGGAKEGALLARL